VHLAQAAPEQQQQAPEQQAPQQQAPEQQQQQQAAEQQPQQVPEQLQPQQAAEQQQLEQPGPHTPQHQRALAPAAPQRRASPSTAGRLLVRETKIVGGQQAVHCRGSGAIRRVRVIYQRSLPLYFFDVDSADPGSRAALAAAQPWPGSGWAAAAAAAGGAAVEAEGGGCGGWERQALGVAGGGLGKRLQPRSIQAVLGRLDPAALQQLLRRPAESGGGRQ
jgi:hypothetical protein